MKGMSALCAQEQGDWNPDSHGQACEKPKELRWDLETVAS